MHSSNEWPVGLLARVKTNLVCVELQQVQLSVVQPHRALGTAVRLIYGTGASTKVNTPAEDDQAPMQATVGRLPKGTWTRKTLDYCVLHEEIKPSLHACDSAAQTLAA